MPTRVRSFCKINLGLAVGPARPDGFHGLTTCYQTLALHDIVTVTARPAPGTCITLNANHPGVPRTETADAERNTAYRMIAAALDRLNLTAEVSIDIKKRLPVQGGLGAGSANAIAALIGLEHELSQTLAPEPWTLNPGPWTLNPAERLALAAEIGSDVPLFLLGGTVLGLGRGEEVYPLPDLPATPCVIAIPETGVSTAAAFRDLDARIGSSTNPPSQADLAADMSSRPKGREASRSGETCSSPPPISPEASNRLTPGGKPDRLKELSCALAAVWTASGADLGKMSGITRTESTASDASSPSPSGIASGDLAETSGSPWNGVLNPLLALVRTGIVNDFEEVVFAQHPSLRSIKRDLMGSGSDQALYAALSGSGSALFGLYRSTADAAAAQQRVQASGTRALLTETLPRPEYWRTMLEI